MLHGRTWAIPLGRDQREDTVRERKGISLSPLSLSDIIIFRSTAPVADTRHVLFYYRRLPDDRIMMGGRGPIDERTVDRPRWKKRLLGALRNKFPPLSGLTIDYYWAGWVCLPFDAVPHVHHLDEHPKTTATILVKIPCRNPFQKLDRPRALVSLCAALVAWHGTYGLVRAWAVRVSVSRRCGVPRRRSSPPSVGYIPRQSSN